MNKSAFCEFETEYLSSFGINCVKMATSLDTTTKYIIPRLNATNYFNWRFRMEMLLKEKDIWHTISEDKPSNVTPIWIKADEKALATISLMIEDDQIQHIRTSKCAKDA